MVDKRRLTKAERETWDALKSRHHGFIFPNKDATLRITKQCQEVGSVYLNPNSGNMFVYDGNKWRRI